MTNLKYYIDEEFDAKDNNSWIRLLDRFLLIGDAVEFNVLYNDEVLNQLLDKFSIDVLETGRRKNKIYPSGKFVRFKLSHSIREFIFSKSYKSWKNFCLEDMSVLKDGKEIMATITHENYIYVRGTPDQINDINNMGFKFDRPFDLPTN